RPHLAHGRVLARLHICVVPSVRCWLLSFFFFSSRRRHTRFSRDWSSDVCSSDLYMERARSDMLRLAGIDQRAAMEAGEGAWAVTDLAIKYLRPAKLDDDLLVVSTVEAVRGASVVIAQRILRSHHTLSDEMLTDGRATAAFLSPAGRPRRQPAGWASRFTAIMNGESIPC